MMLGGAQAPPAAQPTPGLLVPPLEPSKKSLDELMHGNTADAPAQAPEAATGRGPPRKRTKTAKALEVRRIPPLGKWRALYL